MELRVILILEGYKMKKFVILVFAVIILLALVGCQGGGSGPGPTPSPTPAIYEIRVVNQDLGVSSKGTTTANDPVTQESIWYISYTNQDYSYDPLIDSTGNIDYGVGCWARILENGIDITDDMTPEQLAGIQWTITDADNILYNLSSTTPTGGSWYASANKPGVVRCTVTYQGAVSYSNAIVQYRHSIDFGNVSGTIGEWYDFENRVSTDNPANGDMKYITVAGVNYIYAPYGISLIMNRFVDPYGNGISVNGLGCVKQLPAGLVYDTQLPCQNRGIYAVKTRNGKHVVLDSFLWPTDPNKLTGFSFKVSDDGTYTAHW
jgi:hypothetical protein